MYTSEYLRGWKEIANYLKLGVRTVQRYENQGLPIHRMDGMFVGGVFAFPSEIDAWLKGQSVDKIPPQRAYDDDLKMHLKLG